MGKITGSSLEVQFTASLGGALTQCWANLVYQLGGVVLVMSSGWLGCRCWGHNRHTSTAQGLSALLPE
eukprot:6453669-Ditylum_brightwellii.AAC.1